MENEEMNTLNHLDNAHRALDAQLILDAQEMFAQGEKIMREADMRKDAQRIREYLEDTRAKIDGILQG